MGRVILVSALAFLVLLLPMKQKAFCEDSMNVVIEDIKKIEFGEIKCDKQSENYFGYIEGSIPVLISAPHGAKHYRTLQHRWKLEDSYTSSLAVELGRKTGAYVIYLKNKAGEDPNNDIQTRYKDFLGKIVAEKGIRFVIDLHGAGFDQPFKVDVGTLSNNPDLCSCPTFRPIIQQAFQGFDENIFNKHFRARNCATITGFVRNDLGVEAAQVEINAKYRIIQSRSGVPFKANEDDVFELFERLEKLILDANTAIVKGISPQS